MSIFFIDIMAVKAALHIVTVLLGSCPGGDEDAIKRSHHIHV